MCIRDSAKRPYDKELIPALKETPNLQPGLTTYFLSGSFRWVPRITDLSGAVKKMRADFTYQAPEEGALTFTGYLDVPKSGKYTFKIQHQHGLVVRLHDILVFDADTPRYQRGNRAHRKILQLEKGLHPIQLHCITNFQAPSILWSGPGIKEQAIADPYLKTAK